MEKHVVTGIPNGDIDIAGESMKSSVDFIPCRKRKNCYLLISEEKKPSRCLELHPHSESLQKKSMKEFERLLNNNAESHEKTSIMSKSTQDNYSIGAQMNINDHLMRNGAFNEKEAEISVEEQEFMNEFARRANFNMDQKHCPNCSCTKTTDSIHQSDLTKRKGYRAMLEVDELMCQKKVLKREPWKIKLGLLRFSMNQMGIFSK